MYICLPQTQQCADLKAPKYIKLDNPELDPEPFFLIQQKVALSTTMGLNWTMQSVADKKLAHFEVCFETRYVCVVVLRLHTNFFPLWTKLL